MKADEEPHYPYYKQGRIHPQARAVSWAMRFKIITPKQINSSPPLGSTAIHWKVGIWVVRDLSWPMMGILRGESDSYTRMRVEVGEQLHM